MPEDAFDRTPPHASAIVESLRAFGYDLPTALADLVDNSIAAHARHVWLHFEWAGDASTVSVTDDGDGMSAAELVEAMRLGTRGPLAARAPHDLGRFGLGLKTASLSQCRRLTVRSRRASSPVETRCWDLGVIAATDDWRLLRAADVAAEPRFTRLADQPNGTTVLWQQLDRLTRGQDPQSDRHQQRFLERIDGVRSHLGLVFHRLMTGSSAVRLFVNDRAVEPWDPFLENHPATHRLPVDPLRLGGERVPVRAYVLPHISKLSKIEHEAGAGPRGWLAHQGFYVYRRDRLLVAGDWLGFGWTKDEHLKLARIAIDLPNTLDHEWQINVTKSRATPPAALRDDLKRIAERTRAEAKNVYTHRGARLTAPADSSPTNRLWLHLAKHDRLFYRINDEHPLVRRVLESTSDKPAMRALIALVQESIPLQHIGITAAEEPGSQPEPFEGTPAAQVKEVLDELYRTFRSIGCGHDEAIQRLSSHPPFDQFPELLATITPEHPDA
ncbi:ATP-binding protein [Horticoccus luteus]|uniref:ATP-binding protein n=1 Tax=Horticoccus luteus TaxID=2862869 RepID=A0A8F9TVB4_9BACT|nr:ATP-binding protein [Horticoccus luteus]QYM78958.1 ATP-binding protein [Horticoccus luteus]